MAQLDRAIGINEMASTDGPVKPGHDDKAPVEFGPATSVYVTGHDGL